MNSLQIKVRALVGAIEEHLREFLLDVDRANVIEKLMILRGRWRDIDIGTLKLAAEHATDLFIKAEGKLTDVSMKLAAKAVVNCVHDKDIDVLKLRRELTLKMFLLACFVIKGLEGVKR